jgi:DNA-binding MarR family transcriptional regulator
MSTKRYNPGGQALTDLVLAVFRLNGRLLLAGDKLVADLGLTSARWQVLGAIAIAQSPQPVAWLARSMGLNRQGVQRIVNEMRDEGLIELHPNPHHRRAHLVVLTKRGEDVFAAASRIQTPWANALARQLNLEDLATTRRIVTTLSERLEKSR